MYTIKRCIQLILLCTMAVRCQQDLLFSSQTCRVFESDLPCFDSDLPCLESDFPIFQVSPSRSQFFSFFESDLSIFSGQSVPLFQVSSSHFSCQTSCLPVLCSGLIAMCTVDKIKDVGVCRKRLDCTTNTLARETNQQNTNRQARKTKK